MVRSTDLSLLTWRYGWQGNDIEGGSLLATKPKCFRHTKNVSAMVSAPEHVPPACVIGEQDVHLQLPLLVVDTWSHKFALLYCQIHDHPHAILVLKLHRGCLPHVYESITVELWPRGHLPHRQQWLRVIQTSIYHEWAQSLYAGQKVIVYIDSKTMKIQQTCGIGKIEHETDDTFTLHEETREEAQKTTSPMTQVILTSAGGNDCLVTIARAPSRSRELHPFVDLLEVPRDTILPHTIDFAGEFLKHDESNQPLYFKFKLQRPAVWFSDQIRGQVSDGEYHNLIWITEVDSVNEELTQLAVKSMSHTYAVEMF